MKILLVNPPIYDFTAYDFWLKPLGLLRVAAALRVGDNRLQLFDFLDSAHAPSKKADKWGRGSYIRSEIPHPSPLADTQRKFYRFGHSVKTFEDFLINESDSRGEPFDLALLQVTMTWWYPGAIEVIQTLRKLSPTARIIIGGPYAILCSQHAKTLGADAVCSTSDIQSFLAAQAIPHTGDDQPIDWRLYNSLQIAAVKFSDGCPFGCSYCATSKIYKNFSLRPLETVAAEIKSAIDSGARDIAFYDDALLHRAEGGLLKLLDILDREKLIGRANFHTPNAMNARLLSGDIAKRLVDSGFKTFHLGFESSSEKFQRATGSKVFADEFAVAVENLIRAGVDSQDIVSYMLLGHPDFEMQQTEQSMRFVNSLGVRIMAADFAPVPGTPDGQRCGELIDMNEPLNHNKTAFAIRQLGTERINHLKQLRKTLNAKLTTK